jgi:predicted DNA-binding WGR domain protein
VDTDGHYANPNLLDRYLMQPSILRAFGWRFALILTKDWYHNAADVLNRIEKVLRGQQPLEDDAPRDEEAETSPAERVPAPSVPPPLYQAPLAGEQKKLAETPTVPGPSSAEGPTRHFEFINGSSRKFWEISLSENTFTVRFGRIGTLGQSQTKRFGDEAQAKREADKLIAEKVKKGYVEKRSN